MPTSSVHPRDPDDAPRATRPLARRLFHELNNALSAVTINAVVLSREVEAEDPRSEIVDDILEAARKASALTSQLRRLDAEQRRAPPPTESRASEKERDAV